MNFRGNLFIIPTSRIEIPSGSFGLKDSFSITGIGIGPGSTHEVSGIIMVEVY